jgi:Sulfatase
MMGPPKWYARASYLCCLIVFPFLTFLANNKYGFFYGEVIVAVALLLIPCLLFGTLARGNAFAIVVVILVALSGAYPLALLFHDRMPWPVAAVLLASGAGMAVWIMRDRFYPVLAVFTLSGLLIAVMAHMPWKSWSHGAFSSAKPAHIVWILLDEQMGLAGLPNTPACGEARDGLTKVLEKYNFTIYPYAYSNYAGTIDSVPSILNERLLQYPHQLIDRTGQGNLRQYRIRGNRAFTRFAAEGYRVVAYQYASLRFCEPFVASAECHDYTLSLSTLHRAPGNWRDRFRWLVGNYQASDPVRTFTRGFFFFRLGVRMPGPLGVSEIWPDHLAADILSRDQPTFFFAHLLTPHSPYLYRSDGSVRDLHEWSDDRADERVSAIEYKDRYHRYCEQVQYVSNQLDRFLETLSAHGSLNRMTVVVHGDHGSRIRLNLDPNAKAPEDEDAETLDTGEDTDARDLMNHFSALLAIKAAGAAKPRISNERHAILTLLDRDLFRQKPADGIARTDLVYLIDPQRHYRPVQIDKYWR